MFPEKNDRNIIPKIENLSKESTWAFTINPSNQYFDDPERILKIDRYTKKLLNTHRISYKLYHEVSPNGRWHYHGYIKIQDPMLFYVLDIPRIIAQATIAIEPLVDDEGWEEYIDKQQHLLLGRPIIKPYGIDFEPGLIFQCKYTINGNISTYEKRIR